MFPESYYLFIPFIGKLKEVGLYDKFISSTEIWDSFDTRIMVLRSICNAVKNETWLNARQITIPEYFNRTRSYFHPNRHEIKSLLFDFLNDLFYINI